MPVSYVEVDRTALRHNARVIRSLLPPAVHLMAVVKADGYGHGATETLRIALEEGYTAAAVAYVHDGCVLRQEGFTCPVYVLGLPLEEDMRKGVENDLILTVDDTSDLDELERMAVAAKKVIEVMMAVDTGMNRIGVRPCHVPCFLDKLVAYPHLRLHGVMTHMATADEEDKKEAREQMRRFAEVLPFFSKDEDLVVSAANSAGILDLPESRYNMVRAGIVLYGLHPSAVMKRKPDLRPAMRIVSHVTHVHVVYKGEAVGYGATYVAPQDTVIATVPIGYAEGYPLSLSNRGVVLIRGKRYSVAGQICMDQLMIVVDGAVRLGDEVVLLGKQGEECISAEDAACLAGTTAVAFVCGMKRLPRLFVGE